MIQARRVHSVQSYIFEGRKTYSKYFPDLKSYWIASSACEHLKKMRNPIVPKFGQRKVHWIQNGWFRFTYLCNLTNSSESESFWIRKTFLDPNLGTLALRRITLFNRSLNWATGCVLPSRNCFSNKHQIQKLIKLFYDEGNLCWLSLLL